VIVAKDGSMASVDLEVLSVRELLALYLPDIEEMTFTSCIYDIIVM